MRHVKLARDRRKRKSRIKAAIFFIALLSIFTGGILSLKDSAENKAPENTTVREQIHPLTPETESSDIGVETSLEPSLNNPQNTEDSADSAEAETANNPENESDDATSYDDELQEQDDEIEGELPEEARSALNDLLDVADQALRINNQFSHTVVRGDSLKDVLELSGLDEETSKALISQYPELKNLRAGQQFYWILDNHNDLEYMNWLVSEKEERIYESTPEGNFKRQILEKKSLWKREVLRGEIGSSLNASLRAQGLDGRQINQLTTALQWQIAISKLKKGDKFALLISREYIGEKLTGQGNVEAIHIVSQGKSYYAIQAGNGRYYNRHGETLGKGFARYPMQRQARVSSQFNPRRRHPVTGRIAPHKGVDFSMPTGTPVIAPADGVVERVAYQGGGAGRYIMIRHGREYQTVYMHLSKPLVRPGQSVKRGERIALSGNTGRSTGPHLHYEFHINGRPVNPLTVKLPGTSSGMGTEERKAFLGKAKSAEAQLRIK